MSPTDARLVHQLDQIRAQLRDLVAMTREHLPECGALDFGGCCGDDAFDILARLDHGQTRRLLMVALLELGHLPAPSDSPERTPAP